jgi:hypothetical protein
MIVFFSPDNNKKPYEKTANFCESKKATNGSSFYFFTKTAVFE